MTRMMMAAVVLLLGLAACQADDAATETQGTTPPSAGASVTVPAPQSTAPTPQSYVPGQPLRTEAACLGAGGRWARGGMSPDPQCFITPADAGKSCAKASDCQTYCLAESRTCAAQDPLFGCFGYLDEDGREITICSD